MACLEDESLTTVRVWTTDRGGWSCVQVAGLVTSASASWIWQVGDMTPEFGYVMLEIRIW